jgi:hypothetical protein
MGCSQFWRGMRERVLHLFLARPSSTGVSDNGLSTFLSLHSESFCSVYSVRRLFLAYIRKNFMYNTSSCFSFYLDVHCNSGYITQFTWLACFVSYTTATVRTWTTPFLVN